MIESQVLPRCSVENEVNEFVSSQSDKAGAQKKRCLSVLNRILEVGHPKKPLNKNIFQTSKDYFGLIQLLKSNSRNFRPFILKASKTVHRSSNNPINPETSEKHLRFFQVESLYIENFLLNIQTSFIFRISSIVKVEYYV